MILVDRDRRRLRETDPCTEVSREQARDVARDLLSRHGAPTLQKSLVCLIQRLSDGDARMLPFVD